MNPLLPTTLYSAEAELAVLGGMLLDPAKVFALVTDTLRPDDFFVPAHIEIFDALMGMKANGIAIDAALLHHWLTDQGLAEECGSPGILGDLMGAFTTHHSTPSYLKIVQDKSKLRKLRDACGQIMQDIMDDPSDVPKIIDRAEKAIFLVGNVAQEAPALNAGQLTAAFMEHLGQIQRGEKKAYVKTGYACIDRVNGGFKPKGFHVIGARSGVGKTTIALNFAENLCKNGVGVGIISLEMEANELMAAIYAFMADIDSRAFKAKLTDEQLGDVKWANDAIAQWNLQVDDCSLMDILRMRHKCRQMVKNGAEVLIIDYLQLLESDDEGAKRSRHEQVSAMSRSIKLLAKELGVPIIVGAQLNRDAAGKEPGLHNLRESGAIEQDADVVLLLRMADESDKGPRPMVKCNVAKWRGGKMNFDLDFIFDKAKNRFIETTPKKENQ